jgi:hypothetical protein
MSGFLSSKTCCLVINPEVPRKKFLRGYFLYLRNGSYLFALIQIRYHTQRWVRSWVSFVSLLFCLNKIKGLRGGSSPLLGTIEFFLTMVNPGKFRILLLLDTLISCIHDVCFLDV